MSAVQDMIDTLVRVLSAALPGYTVEAREPLEGELVASTDTRQVFITTEGLELPEGYADGGETVRVLVPVLVACVMQRPGTVELAKKTLRRRLTLAQGVQRAAREFALSHPHIAVNLLEERPELIEGYYVSVTGLEIMFDMDTEETV